jgi:Abscisic acid G-protein coupled receptor
MHSSLQSQFSSLHFLHSRQARQKTPLGLLVLLARHLFALYCIYRILSTAWSNFRVFFLGLPTVSSDEDPISRILAILATPWTTAPLDIDAYRHLIGFVLVGIVIAASINRVMSTIQRLSKSSPLSPAASTLSISWISGTYFVSTAVMLRSNLPEKYVGGIGNALGSSLQRGIFEIWFDVVFFVVAIVTGVGLVMARSWNYNDNIEVEGKEV